MSLLLGIDLGTSSVKVAVVDAKNLQVLAHASRDYAIHHPKPGYAEQNPEEWWQAIVEAVQQVNSKVDRQAIQAIGVSGQMHGLVCVDSSGIPVHPAIIWADTRSSEQVESLKRLQANGHLNAPGLPASGFAASTALWLSQNHPETLAQTYMCLIPKDYIVMRMTGEFISEPSDASASWLFDATINDWNETILEYCGLKRSQLPPIMRSDAVVGQLTAESAEQLGLSTSVAVVAGTADLPAQGLAHGIVEPDSMLVTVGTGGQIFVPRTSPEPDEQARFYVFAHNVAGQYYSQAAILSGGVSLIWLSDILGQTERDFAHLSKLASTVPEGADGLLFLPYLSGERSPHMDPQASGMLFGLRLHHTQAHIVRAVMEGVAFALKQCLELVSTDDQPFTTVTLSGGATKSAVWSQILADILNLPLQLVESDEPHGCIGAAILAGMGVDAFNDVHDALSRRRLNRRIVTPVAHDLYTTYFEVFRRLYPLLKEEMYQLQTSNP